MYASVSTTHEPLGTPAVETHLQNGERVIVTAHLGTKIYLSFTPDEAHLLGEKLLKVAAEAEAAQARLDALAPPSPAEAVAV